MEKLNNRGYILAETLIVTAFVASVLIYLYIQLTNLSNNYERVQKYNTVPGLYALETIANLIKSDDGDQIRAGINTIHVLDLYEYVDNYSNPNWGTSLCLTLIEEKNIEKIYITPNYFDSYGLNIINELHTLAEDPKFDEFIDTIHPSGIEDYRLIAKFSDDTYATLRF
jgi:hypothetical protein